MKAKKFTKSEIDEFVNSLKFPVLYFINEAGNIEFSPVDNAGQLINPNVWFKFVRSIMYGADCNRFWKCAAHSSCWQLFRDSRSGIHTEFATPKEAADRMNMYFAKHGYYILNTEAYCPCWKEYSFMKKNFRERAIRKNVKPWYNARVLVSIPLS